MRLAFRSYLLIVFCVQSSYCLSASLSSQIATLGDVADMLGYLSVGSNSKASDLAYKISDDIVTPLIEDQATEALTNILTDEKFKTMDGHLDEIKSALDAAKSELKKVNADLPEIPGSLSHLEKCEVKPWHDDKMRRIKISIIDLQNLIEELDNMEDSLNTLEELRGKMATFYGNLQDNAGWLAAAQEKKESEPIE